MKAPQQRPPPVPASPSRKLAMGISVVRSGRGYESPHLPRSRSGSGYTSHAPVGEVATLPILAILITIIGQKSQSPTKLRLAHQLREHQHPEGQARLCVETCLQFVTDQPNIRLSGQ